MPFERLQTARNKVVGSKQTGKAVQRGQAQEVYVAEDAESKVVAPIIKLCEEKGIPVVRVATMNALGKACGIEVGCACAAIVKEG